MCVRARVRACVWVYVGLRYILFLHLMPGFMFHALMKCLTIFFFFAGVGGGSDICVYVTD